MDVLLQPVPLWLIAALFAYIVSLVFYLNNRSQQRQNELERRLDNLTRQASEASPQLRGTQPNDKDGAD